MKQRSCMTTKDVRAYVRLAARWDFVCVICGNAFESVACITREHLVPRSWMKKHLSRRSLKALRRSDNVAPSHFRCNQLRGNVSLLAAQGLLERKRLSMNPHDFRCWLNAGVPHRAVPPAARLPPDPNPLNFRFVPACFALPERVPGM